MDRIESKRNRTRWISMVTVAAFTAGALGCEPADEASTVDHSQREFTAELFAYGEDETGKAGLQPLSAETFKLGDHRWLDREILVDGRATRSIDEMLAGTEIVVPLNDGGKLTLRRNGQLFESQALARPDSSEAVEMRAFAIKDDAFELFRRDNADDSKPNAVMKISGLDDLAGVRRTLVATLALGTMLATLEDGENIAPAVAIALIAARVSVAWFRSCARSVTACAVRCARNRGFEVKCAVLKVKIDGGGVSIRPTFGFGCKCL